MEDKRSNSGRRTNDRDKKKCSNHTLIHILGAVVSFVIGMATGIMLMQTNPRNPNIDALKSKTSEYKQSIVTPSQQVPPPAEKLIEVEK